MKKSFVIGIVAGIIVISVAFFLFNYIPRESTDNTESIDNTEIEEIVCENYTSLEVCSSHPECEWISNESKCALINSTDNEAEFNQESEEADSNNISNSICNQLPLSSDFGSDDKYYCLSVVNHNPDFCGKMLDDTEQPDTLEKSDNSEEPGDLNDRTPLNICLAISGKDSSYCKEIARDDAKKTCYNVLAQTSGNINFCSDISYSQSDKQQCYFNFVNALYWEDRSEEITTEDCDKIGMDDDQDEKTCLAFKERDVSLCGSNKNCLTFFPQKMSFCDGATFKDEEECIRDRAMVNEDISICGTLSEQTRRDDCYGDFSSHIQPSTTICDKIIDVQRRQGCYIDAAINLAE